MTDDEWVQVIRRYVGSYDISKSIDISKWDFMRPDGTLERPYQPVMFINLGQDKELLVEIRGAYDKEGVVSHKGTIEFRGINHMIFKFTTPVTFTLDVEIAAYKDRPKSFLMIICGDATIMLKVGYDA